jgi:NitT/TauT family transport system substrate-binding protein
LGLLPIADTILLHVAQGQGYFEKRGLLVELTPFQSALEKDSAVMAGQLDGHFCEISSAMVQRAQGRPYKIVATTSHTEPNERVFGIVAKPNSKAKSLADVKGQSLGVARQTIVDFLADAFLARAGLPQDYFERRDVRKIPLRLQTLIAGRLDLSVFPEPLLSMAEKAGGAVLVDDRDLDMPLAAVALKDEFATPAAVEALRAALAEAVAYANANPGPIRELMLSKGLISKSLAEGWTPPTYNPAHIPDRLPDKALFEAYVDWLARNDVLRRADSPGPLRPAPEFADSIYQAGR